MEDDRPPRVCIYSSRTIHSHVARCAGFEFEDVIRNVDSADLVVSTPAPYFDYGSRVSNRFSRHLGIKPFNPGLQRIDVDRQYDIFFALCMFPSDLANLSALRGWRKQSDIAVCWLDEIWAANVSLWRGQMKLLSEFDFVILNNSGSVRSVEQAIGRPCYYLPIGIDALKFCPLPNAPRRCIDVYSMGRRMAEVHRQLMSLAEMGSIYYVHDTIQNLHAKDWHEHRLLVSATAKRSRLFVAYRAKIGRNFETKGQEEIGSRYFEGAASGAVVIGSSPRTNEWDDNFDWPDSVIELPAEIHDVPDWLDDLLGDDERLARARTANVVNSLRRHDWAHRWRKVLELASLEPLPPLIARLNSLERLAGTAAAGLRAV